MTNTKHDLHETSALYIPPRVFEKDGSTVVCDEVSFGFLKGAKVEFEDNLMRSAFTVSVQS